MSCIRMTALMLRRRELSIACFHLETAPLMLVTQVGGTISGMICQGRVYVTDSTLEEVAAKVEKQGREEASKVFEDATVISVNHGNWDKRTLSILDAPSWSD